MSKTHLPKKIIFFPINIEISYDESQGIYFVFLETKPFDYEEVWPVKNPTTGKLEGKSETRKFSRLRLVFNSQQEINNFSSSVKKGQFYEVETSWSSGVKSGRNGEELVNQVNINEENLQIKNHLIEKETSAGVSGKSNNDYTVWILAVGGVLILGIILGLLWRRRKQKIN